MLLMFEKRLTNKYQSIEAKRRRGKTVPANVNVFMKFWHLKTVSFN